MRRVSTAGSGSSAFLSALFRRLPSGVILNVGAGAARCATPGQTVVHVDHIPPTNEPPPLFVVADATALPFRPGSFHGVLMKDVLEHVLDCVGALAEARRVSKHRSRVVVEVPRAIPRAVWGDPTHVRGFTRSALLTAFAQAGWEPRGRPVRVGGFPGAGRLRLEERLLTLMKIPLFGHVFGTNWLLDGSTG